MKLLAIMFLISASSVFAQADYYAMLPLLTCESEHRETAIYLRPMGRSKGTVRHNYATADIVCSTYMEVDLKDKKDFECAGMWAFDSNRERSIRVNTVVKVSFKHDGENYKASFQASNDYDNEELVLNCEQRILK